MKAKTGYRMVTQSEMIANPIVVKGALCDTGYGTDAYLWKKSKNVGRQKWSTLCNYCVPKDFVFPSEGKNVVKDIPVPATKMNSFKAWAICDKDCGEVMMPPDGEYPIDNHILIFSTRQDARKAKIDGERVVKVMITEIL